MIYKGECSRRGCWRRVTLEIQSVKRYEYSDCPACGLTVALTANGVEMPKDVKLCGDCQNPLRYNVRRGLWTCKPCDSKL